MAGSLARLERLGGSVAVALQGAAPGRARALADASRAFLMHELGSRSRPRRLQNAARIGAFGLALLVLVSVAWLSGTRRAPLTFNVNGAPGVANTWLAAPRSEPLQLRFSEGTSVRLEAAARARIVELDPRGASVSLESGRAHLEVVHQADTAWKVSAGPYTVLVTGTVFDVNWEPDIDQLSVSVTRGSVTVRESSSGVEQPVHAPQTLRTTSSEGRFELVRDEANSEPAPSEEPAPNEEPAPSVVLAPDLFGSDAPAQTATVPDGAPAVLRQATEPTRAKKSPAKVTHWREYAKRGALREAFADAEAEGFSASCAGASAAELLLLGDGARLSGNADRAVDALLTLRRRFPADARRAAAAFALGKVAFDQRRSYAQAAEWFSTSLREQPKGPLARESSGRLIEALRRAGDAAGARGAARDYLDQYPEGPHADVARSALR